MLCLPGYREGTMRIGIALAIVAIGLISAISPSFASETITYTYDALGRLVKVAHTGTVNNNMQTVYTNDPADNRTNVATTGAPHSQVAVIPVNGLTVVPLSN